MKKVTIGTFAVTAYTNKDLEDFKDVFQEAREAWKILTDHQRRTRPKDHGSIIMGDGIAVWHLRPRCRKPEKKIVVHPGAQGCGYYEPYKDFILGFLKERGIDAHYCYGRMD